MSKSSFKDTDKGYAALMKRLTSAKPVRLTVGVHEEEGSLTYPDGTTVAEVASYNELGLGVPRRSFIADWVDETEDAKRKDLQRAGVAVIRDGKDLEERLQGLGANYVGQVRDRMGDTKPDDPKTEEEKGSSEPLDDTGLLRSSIKHRVTHGTSNGSDSSDD